MSFEVPGALADLLHDVERQMAPVEELDLSTKLQRVAPKDLADAQRSGARAEVFAFLFMVCRGDDSPWGKYFCPMASGTTTTGEPFFQPDARQFIDAETIDYWRSRALASPHPALRARYADLVWEFEDFVSGRGRDAKMASIAADAYCAIVEQHVEAHEHQAWPALSRALELAFLISDNGLGDRAKGLLLAYFQKLYEAGPRFMWWPLPLAVREHKRLRQDKAVVAGIVAMLEGILSRHTDINNREWFDHFQAKDAARHLAYFYDLRSEPEAKAMALRRAAEAFQVVAGKADGLLASMLLPEAHALYREAGLPEKVAEVEKQVVGNKDKARAEMKPYSVDIPISPEELEEYLAKFAAGEASEALARVAATFTIKRDDTQNLVKSIAKTAVLSSLLSIDIVGADGFSVARVGSVGDDLEGRTIQQGATSLGIMSSFLGMGLDRVKSVHSLTTDKIVEYLGASPVFANRDMATIRAGIDAWFAGDDVKAIHVLVPQIEAASRVILTGLGGSIRKPNRNGGFDVLGMGAILQADQMRDKFDPSIRLHLVTLYCAPQGWNLRNNIAHGLASYDQMGAGVANWVIHSLLMLGLVGVKRTPAARAEVAPEVTSTGSSD